MLPEFLVKHKKTYSQRFNGNHLLIRGCNLSVPCRIQMIMAVTLSFNRNFIFKLHAMIMVTCTLNVSYKHIHTRYQILILYNKGALCKCVCTDGRQTNENTFGSRRFVKNIHKYFMD